MQPEGEGGIKFGEVQECILDQNPANIREIENHLTTSQKLFVRTLKKKNRRFIISQ